MSTYFPEIKKTFGFGCMRLPMRDGDVIYEQFIPMVDRFLEEGFNYFDTAHGYLGGKSETALRDCLAKRHPREAFVLTDKLTEPYFEREEDIRPFFESQLKACGVDYFDFYLMHAQNASNYKKFQACRAYETAAELKKEGKIRHVGLSFHDRAAVLDQILTEHPEVEVVQIQFNYVDYEYEGVESRLCYEVCRKHGKPVIVMEPVKGGSLVNLPANAAAVLSALGGGSPASYAIRYAASFEGMCMVLSGMSNMEQMEDNLSYMKEFEPLSEREFAAIAEVRDIILNQGLIPCTACRYCTDGCPAKIEIPAVLASMNKRKQLQEWGAVSAYRGAVTGRGRASDCIRCGKCEKACPQHLPIRDLLAEIGEIFDK
ncbi:MAG: aldo/keto reductase [Lachnospiraceae bacterium]|nr:aldo/keto reductase [Lachnospiraceae bacterium]